MNSDFGPRIQALEAHVNELESNTRRIEALENRVAELEQRLGGRPAGTQRMELQQAQRSNPKLTGA